MAEFTIQAGAKIDLFTKKEATEVLRGWFEEIHRGVKFQEFAAQATANAAGIWTVGGSGSTARDTLGPQDGFVWAVTRLAVSGGGFDRTADDYSVYTDEITASKLVVTVPGVATSTGSWEWDTPGLVLVGGRSLALQGQATAESVITVSGAAVELPIQLAYQLL